MPIVSVIRDIEPGFLTKYNWSAELAADNFLTFMDQTTFIHYVVMPGTIKMKLIHRTQVEFFQNTVEREINSHKNAIGIAGCFANNYTLGGYATRVGPYIPFHAPTPPGAPGVPPYQGPVLPNLQDPMGYIVENRTAISSSESRPGLAFLSYDSSKSPVLTIGIGNPPTDAEAAYGGLGPVIIKSITVPDASSFGDRANNKYKAMVNEGIVTGINIVAISAAGGPVAPPHGLVVALTKHHGLRVHLNTIRDNLFKAGFANAVFMDGGDSVFYYIKKGKDTNWFFRPGAFKNRITTYGLCFYED